MGISTTGFVLTEKKDVFEILTIIENTLIELIRKYSDGDHIFRDKTSSFPVIKCSPRLGYFTLCFKVNNKSRMLSVHFDCDSDYKDYGNSKIIWSVNYWGIAEEIILSICKVMKEYGKVFYEANDFDGEIIEL